MFSRYFAQSHLLKQMLPSHLLRFHLPVQCPPSQGQRRHVQQHSRILQSQPELGLDRLYLFFRDIRLRLPFNHRFYLYLPITFFPCRSLYNRFAQALGKNIKNRKLFLYFGMYKEISPKCYLTPIGFHIQYFTILYTT